MISLRLQQRLLAVRCVHSTARSRASLSTQRRHASSTSSSSAARQPAARATPAAKRTASPPPPPSPSLGSGAAAATRARINAEKEVPLAETAEEYKARYKSAARRWTATVIALPILLVTSYYLFDRLALGHAPKVLNREATKQDD